MAEEAGLYDVCWRPDEHGFKKAADLIPVLRTGLELLKSDPPRFQKFNPENGWGSYEGFVRWVENYLEACEKDPDADVEISR